MRPIDGRLDSPLTRPQERVAPANARPSGLANDALSITTFAEALQAIESGSSEDTMVNSSRVVGVQQALASGNYQINSQQLAENLLDFELQVHGRQG